MEEAIDWSTTRGVAAPYYALLYLPSGLAQGFCNVCLSYVLGHAGVSYPAIAGIISLSLLPSTLSFLAGPLVDVSLRPKLIFLICVVALAGALVGYAVTPDDAAHLPLLAALTLTANIAGAVGVVSVTSVMAQTTPPEKRPPVAGWRQVANYGGGALGGGLSLWLVSHAGGVKTAALTLAVICLLTGAPILRARTLRLEVAVDLGARVLILSRDLWAFAKSRIGVLVILLNVLPAALLASPPLLSASSDAWRVSADMVALSLGTLSGIIVIPGCLMGAWLSSRLPKRTLYVGAAVAYEAVLAIMAIGPHTPLAFVAGVLAASFFNGVANTVLVSITYEAIDPINAGTLTSVLSSLSNLPLLLMTLVLGKVAVHGGADGILIAESGIGVAAMAVFVAIATVWRPARGAEAIAALAA
jgi:predicted MFS family arabinose efflux permease